MIVLDKVSNESIIIVVGLACCGFTIFDWNDIMNLFLITAMYGLYVFHYTHTCASIDEALAFANTQDYFASSITVCES